MGWGNFINNVGIASKVWKEADQENEDRAYLKEMRALQVERGKKDNELLGARNTSELARYGLAGDEAAAKRKNVAAEGALSGLKTNNELERAKAEQDDLGSVLATDKAKRETAKLQTEYQLGAEKFNVEDLPRRITAMRQQGAIEDADRYTHVLAGLHVAVNSGDPNQVLRYVNAAIAESDGTTFDKNDPVTEVKKTEAPITDRATGQQKMAPVLAFKTKNGKSFVIAQEVTDRAYRKVNPPKMQVLGQDQRAFAVPAEGGAPEEVIPQAEKWSAANSEGVSTNERTGDMKVAPNTAGNLDKRMKNVMGYIDKYAGANQFAKLSPEERNIILRAGLDNARVLLQQNPEMSEAEAAQRGIETYLKNSKVEKTRKEGDKSGTPQNVEALRKKFGF